MSKIFSHKARSAKKPAKPPDGSDDNNDPETFTFRNNTETFSFLSPFSNLDLYPEMDHPPYFDFGMKVHPSMLDVIKVRHFLSSKLPTEIIDVLLDLAEYWPHTSSILDMTTRVYHDHMRYGSYGKGPKTWWHNRSSTPEMRREWKENGFVLRTPPLGLRCLQTDNRKKTLGQSWPTSSLKNENNDHGLDDWLPPRGKYPARAVLFEILSREERATDHPSAAPGYRPDSRTLFEASVDRIVLPPSNQKPTPRSHSQPHSQLINWTPEAATTKSYLLNPLTKESPYTFLPRRSSSDDSGLNQVFPVFWNRTAQNRKFVVAYRYDDTASFSVERERYLSASIVRGFVRSLREGDSVVLWARAREGVGPCCNVVDRVKVHVFWAV